MKYDEEKGFIIEGREAFTENQRDEIKVLTGLLKVLADGIVKPNDITYQISRLKDLEEKKGIDLSEIINCCPSAATIREAKDFKPLLFKVLAKINRYFPD